MMYDTLKFPCVFLARVPLSTRMYATQRNGRGLMGHVGDWYVDTVRTRKLIHETRLSDFSDIRGSRLPLSTCILVLHVCKAKALLSGFHTNAVAVAACLLLLLLLLVLLLPLVVLPLPDPTVCSSFGGCSIQRPRLWVCSPTSGSIR